WHLRRLVDRRGGHHRRPLDLRGAAGRHGPAAPLRARAKPDGSAREPGRGRSGLMAFEVPIERGKIREFARATGSANPAYDGPDAVIPPTFLTTAGNFWATPADLPTGELGFELARVLHGEEEYEFFGAP